MPRENSQGWLKFAAMGNRLESSLSDGTFLGALYPGSKPRRRFGWIWSKLPGAEGLQSLDPFRCDADRVVQSRASPADETRSSVFAQMECALDGGQFSSGVFDRLLGVAILVLRGAQIA